MLLALTMSAGSKAAQLEHVPLRWKPTSELKLSTLDGFDAATKIETFQDVRHNREAIGENLEDDKPKPVTTNDDVGTFVTGHVRELLERAGIRTVESDAAVTIKGEVRQFFVKETHTYNSQVTLHLTVLDRNGNRLWSGVASGEATHFGRSYKLENYYEALSDAIVNVVTSMLHSSGFQKALSAH
jgi:hypothetical protein